MLASQLTSQTLRRIDATVDSCKTYVTLFFRTSSQLIYLRAVLVICREPSFCLDRVPGAVPTGVGAGAAAPEWNFWPPCAPPPPPKKKVQDKAATCQNFLHYILANVLKHEGDVKVYSLTVSSNTTMSRRFLVTIPIICTLYLIYTCLQILNRHFAEISAGLVSSIVAVSSWFRCFCHHATLTQWLRMRLTGQQPLLISASRCRSAFVFR